MSRKNRPASFFGVEERLTNHAKNSIIRAWEIARAIGCEKIQPIHLFFSIFEERGSLGSSIMKDLGLRKESFLSQVKKVFPEKKVGESKSVLKKNQEIILDPESQKVITRAYAIAKNLSYPYVGTEHLVYALLESPVNSIKEIITSVGKKSVKPALARGLLQENNSIPRFFDFPEGLSLRKKKGGFPTPAIDRYCQNINSHVEKKKEVIVGREKELQRMTHILARKNKNNPVLVGNPGTGKTALVMGLATKINSGQTPRFLANKKIMGLDLAKLVAGTSFRGEFESRLKEIIDEIKAEKNIILFIDELHSIVGTGNISGSLDLANILKPALSDGEIQIIGATTFSEYKKYIEKDQALERRFQPVEVKEPSKEETSEILLGIKEVYENFHNVALKTETVELAVELADKYIEGRFFPDKAIDVLDEAAAKVRSEKDPSEWKEIGILEKEIKNITREKEELAEKEDYEAAIEKRALEKTKEAELEKLKERRATWERKNRIEVSPRDIFETVSRISLIPEEKISQAKNSRLKNISSVLAERIVGQKEVTEKISRTLWRSQLGISSSDRPLGSFLFLGPTGTGKTLTAKMLAEEFFRSSGSLIRFDMSEFMERHNVSGLIGSPAGYIGYGEGGRLTEKVRKNPHSVVLFDEIEKAHPDVFNILLQILEDGILTDAEGLEVSFKNTIVILTSNIETSGLSASPLGFQITRDFEKSSDFSSLKELESKMRPELLGRLDHILIFKSLSKKEMEKIASLEIGRLETRLAKRGWQMTVDKKALSLLAEKSVDPKKGARLIRKNIQEMIEDRLAEAILKGKSKKTKIKISVAKDKITLR